MFLTSYLGRAESMDFVRLKPHTVYFLNHIPAIIDLIGFKAEPSGSQDIKKHWCDIGEN